MKGLSCDVLEKDSIYEKPSHTTMVSMRDGTRLYTEIYLPAVKSCFPVILLRAPYPFSRLSLNDPEPIKRYTTSGYAFVFQSARGQYLSEGCFHYYSDEESDGSDCVQWLVSQVWCNGNVGMEGASYAGTAQLRATRAKPKGLKCIMPTAFVGGINDCHPFRGGVPARGSFLGWHQTLDCETREEVMAIGTTGNPLDDARWVSALFHKPLVDAGNVVLQGDKLASWRETMIRPPEDRYWSSIFYNEKDVKGLDLPVFYTAGWLDSTLGTIAQFQQHRQLKPDDKDVYLLVGPWDHGQTYRQQLHHLSHGDREMPDNAQVDLVAQRLRYFDRYLKGKTDTTIQPDRVRVYITGLDRWLDLPSFPAPDTIQQRLYLHSTGHANSSSQFGILNCIQPEQEFPDNYIYNPDDPAPSAIVSEQFTDRVAFELREDVLTYTTEPLQNSLTILGEIILNLHAATDGRDTDWFAQVTEVFPDGRSIAFHGGLGALRARYREGFDKPKLLTPDKPAEYRISLGHAGHQIEAGNRLRLSIFSSYFPLCDTNSNTGNIAATDTEVRIAKQTIYHDLDRTSHLILPVINVD